jgi:predicted alpha/beta superfamily hydrolase
MHDGGSAVSRAYPAAGAAVLFVLAGFLFYGPDVRAARHQDIARAPNVRTLPLASAVFNNTRDLRVYLPPGYDGSGPDSKYPVLYLNDGFAVFAERLWNAPAQLEGLIREGRVPPMILVGIDNAASIDGARTPVLDRTSEYLPYPDPTEPDVPAPRGQLYPRFLFDEVMPLVERTFRIDTGRVGLGGSSYGGIAALHSVVAAHRPISSLLLESTPLFLFGERLTRDVPSTQWPRSIYVGVGSKETDDAAILASGKKALEHFVAAAKASGARVTFNRVEGAEHNAAAWRTRFPTAIDWLYGR